MRQFYLACEDSSSQRAPSAHHRNAIAMPLQGDWPFGNSMILSTRVIGCLLPFTVRLANPEVTLPR